MSQIQITSDSITTGNITSGTPTQITVVKSDDLWRSERDIVLCTVEQKDTCVVHTMYGVLKSILGTSSQCFQDIFDGPQDAFIVGPDSSQTYERLPVMRMSDNAADVDAYLRAIYFPWYRDELLERDSDPRHGLVRVPFAFFGILRLAHKYMSPDAFIRALERVFRKMWPQELPKWTKRERRLEDRAYEFRPLNADPDDGELEWDQTDLFPDPISTYTFALQHPSIHDILPTIAYDIVHAQIIPIPFTDGGFRRLNCSLLGEQAGILRAGNEVMRLDCRRKLAFDLFVNIGIDATQCRYTQGAAYPYDLACFVALETFWLAYVIPMVLSPTRPIDLLNFPIDIYPEGVCASCASAVSNHLHNAQYVLWVKLPIYFRLAKLVSQDWGFGPDRALRYVMLPPFWQKEVMDVLKRGPGDGHVMYEQLRNLP